MATAVLESLKNIARQTSRELVTSDYPKRKNCLRNTTLLK